MHAFVLLFDVDDSWLWCCLSRHYCRHALISLLNVSRRTHLALVVAEVEECAHVIVDLMQMFRDKELIFCLSCELLTRLVVANPKIKVSRFQRRNNFTPNLLCAFAYSMNALFGCECVAGIV